MTTVCTPSFLDYYFQVVLSFTAVAISCFCLLIVLWVIRRMIETIREIRDLVSGK